MTTKGRLATVAGIAVVAGAAALGIWWSMRGGRGYTGLAGEYPDKVGVFCEIKQLGQWMPPSEQGQAAAALSESPRGTDPMLQVLSQVWAAPAPLKSATLPDVLRNRPMAVGVWGEGADTRGVALIPLMPGQRQVVEKKAEETLGSGPVQATVEGIELRKVDLSSKVHGDFGKAVWGVSDRWAVMATSPEDLKQVLGRTGKPLSEDPVFLSAVKRFPSDRGALLFVRGTEIARLAKRAEEKREAGATTAESEPPGPPAAGKPEAPAPPAKPSEGPGKAEAEKSAEPGGFRLEGLAGALTSISKGTLQKLLALDNVSSMSLWTAPPSGDQKGWQAAFWLGLTDSSRGLWRIVVEGSPRSPEIDARLPKDGRVYVWGAGKDPGRMYKECMEEFQKVLTPDQMSWVRAGIGAAEGKLDLSFANDLLPTLSDEWCVVSSRTGKTAGHAGFFLALKDPRRFEDLLSKKIAPQLKLEQSEVQGARVWRMGDGGLVKVPLALVVTGGMAVVTDAPDWALATGGSPGKAWEAFSHFGDKANCLVVVDPEVWSKDNDMVVLGSCRASSEGIFASARFPGEGPQVWSREKKDGGHSTTGTSAEGSPAPKASGSI